MPRLLIAGCGFLGEAAADFFSARGWHVAGLTASPESAARLTAAKPYPVLAADLAADLSATARALGTFDVVLHCASSGRGGVEAYEQVYVGGCRHLLHAFPGTRLLFTGSTSVYGQTDGQWVDEDSPAEPDRDTGRRLLAAEEITLAAGGNVLRLAGIYGPARSVLLRKFREGTAVLEAGGHRWINQIHRDDAVTALAAVIARGTAGAIYNVADNTPATQREVYGWIAAFLGAPLPPEGPADLQRKRGWTSKCVNNARLRALGWQPAFPAYRDALPAL